MDKELNAIESTDSQKKVDISHFFEDNAIPMAFNNSPREYYDIAIKMKKDLFYAIKTYGYTLQNGTMRYNFHPKGLYPCTEFGDERIKIKRISVTPHDYITITTEDNRQLDATYNYNVQLWCYWHIYNDIEDKKKKNH